MKPVKSNIPSNCTPISSNCVVWQGPDIDCINLCKGDSISDVVYKLALELCDFQGTTGLSNLDLKCLVDVCVNCPQPVKTINTVFQMLIDKVCELEDLIDTSDTPTPTEQLMTIAQCFRTNNTNGDPITQMSHRDYTSSIGSRICTILGQINTLNQTVIQHNSRITVLENKEDPDFNLPLITPTCVVNPGVMTPMNQVLDALEEQFCQLRAVTGTPTQLGQSIQRQCAGLGQMKSLNNPSTNLGSLPGFVQGSDPMISTIAGTITNLWITVCDMRSAIAGLQDCCGSNDCNKVVINYSLSVNEQRNGITLLFNGLTTIPIGYVNCTQAGSKVTITDGIKTVTRFIDLIAASTDADGVEFSLLNEGFNTSMNYVVKVSPCLKKGNDICEKADVIKTDVPPCPVINSVTATVL